MIFLRTTLALILIAMFSCSKDSSTDQGTTAKTIDALTVKNNEIAGWSYSGQAWIANNLSELTTHIDGQAEVYRRHGFIEAAHQEYSGSVNNSQVLLKLTVYNQGSEANALALYNDADLGFTGAIDWTAGAGQASHYVRNGGLSQVLSFYRNGYLAYLEIGTDTDESLNILKQFALNVDGKIKNG
jgi:hypothetical protein